MKYSCSALVLIGALTAMSPAIAASTSMPAMGTMHAGSMNGTTATAAAAHGFMAHGVVNSVDLVADSVNITHHAIKALGWPGMTMSFPLRDRTDLASVKIGEKVDFDLARSPSGQYVITRLRSAR